MPEPTDRELSPSDVRLPVILRVIRIIHSTLSRIRTESLVSIVTLNPLLQSPAVRRVRGKLWQTSFSHTYRVDTLE
jgi:hypothetical protein